MQCFVYASRRRDGTYVWLRERDQFDVLPAALAEQVGELRFVLEVDLDTDRQLPREDATTVLSHLDDQGWHLQLPPSDDSESSSS
ncbi:MAG TPA: YcgL domain-containing protein [Oleiagrimonas sp.]|nr:YcgL domain-containing protein [Oleiagrimonas sp.]